MNPISEGAVERSIAELAARAPDPSEVLPAVWAGVRRRRTRARALTAGAAAFLVLATAGVAATVFRPSHPNQVTETPGSSPKVTSASPSTSGYVTPADVPTSVTYKLTFAWLPGGLKVVDRTAGVDSALVTYHRDPDENLTVNLVRPTGGWHPENVPAGWSPATVNGRPAVIASRPTRVMLGFYLPSGRWVSLEYTSGPPGSHPAKTQAQLQADALRIANGVADTGTEALSTRVTPTRIPEGLRLLDVTVTAQRVDMTFGRGSGNATLTTTGTEDHIAYDQPAFAYDHMIAISVEQFEPTRTGDPAWVQPLGISIESWPVYAFKGTGGVFISGYHGFDALVGPATADPNANPARDEFSQDQFLQIAKGLRWTG